MSEIEPTTAEATRDGQYAICAKDGRMLALTRLEDGHAIATRIVEQAEVIRELADEMDKLRPLVVFEVLRSDEEWRTAVANMLGVLDALRKAGRLP